MNARIIITGRNNTVPHRAFSGPPNSGMKPGSEAGGTRNLPSSQTVAPGDSPTLGVTGAEVR